MRGLLLTMLLLALLALADAAPPSQAEGGVIGSAQAAVWLTWGCNDTALPTEYLSANPASTGACLATDGPGAGTRALTPQATTLQALRCLASAPPLPGTTWTQTLRVNGTPTTLQCAITPPQTACEGVGSVAVVAGDDVAVQHDDSSAMDGGNVRCVARGTPCEKPCPPEQLISPGITLLGEFAVAEGNDPRTNTPLTTFPTPGGSDIYLSYIDAALEMVVRHYSAAAAAWSAPTRLATSLDDSHCGPTLAVDGGGFVHVVGNMHGTPWQYWRSQHAQDISAFSFRGQDGGTVPCGITTKTCTGQCQADWHRDEPGIAAIPGNSITYHAHTYDTKGNIYLGFRECVDCRNPTSFFARRWSSGVVKYTWATQTWSRIGPRPLALADVDEWGTRSNHAVPYVDGQDRLHVAHLRCQNYSQSEGSAPCFRTHPNQLSYVRTDDDGRSWQDHTGAAVRVPLVAGGEPLALSEQVIVTHQAQATGYWQNIYRLVVGGQTPWLTGFLGAQVAGSYRQHVTVRQGGWTYPPQAEAATLIFPSHTDGLWLGHRPGGALMRTADGGRSWQTLAQLAPPQGAWVNVAWDERAWKTGRQLYLYAQYDAGTEHRIRIYHVRFYE